MPHRIGTKGQVVIAKEIRDELGIGPGWETIQRIVNGRVELAFIPPPHNHSLHGALNAYADPAAFEMDWQAIREAAWDDMAAEAEAYRHDTPTERKAG